MQVGPELELPGYGCEDHFQELDTVEHCWECIAGAFCLLPIAYSLLPAAYCLLPIAYCLLPVKGCSLRLMKEHSCRPPVRNESTC